jgi:hypothetical protein
MNFPTPDDVFRAANLVAACTWIALALSPAAARWAPAVRRIAGRGVPLAFAAAYVVLIVAYWGVPGGGFGSVAQVQTLFSEPGLLVAGWLHYLAFDLFVGAWIARRAAEQRWPHAAVLPLLVLCFLFGPAGLLAFAALRATVFRSAASAPAPAA